jgi:hypothetical protein
MSARSLLALTGLAAVLVALLVLEYHGADLEDATLPTAPRAPSRTAPPRPGLSSLGPGVPQTGAAPSAADRDLTQLDTILARPLFRSARRPPAGAAAAAAGGGVANLPRLTGVLVSRTGRSVIFAAGADGKPLVVAEGGRIGAYLVQSIGAGQAVVVGPDGARTLRPAFGGGPGFGGSPGLGGSAGAQPAASAPAQPSILDLLRNGPAVSVAIPGLPPRPAP